jgi:hypothetical protein
MPTIQDYSRDYLHAHDLQMADNMLDTALEQGQLTWDQAQKIRNTRGAPHAAHAAAKEKHMIILQGLDRLHACTKADHKRSNGPQSPRGVIETPGASDPARSQIVAHLAKRAPRAGHVAIHRRST